jgi:hypothetical protein
VRQLTRGATDLSLSILLHRLNPVHGGEGDPCEGLQVQRQGHHRPRPARRVSGRGRRTGGGKRPSRSCLRDGSPDRGHRVESGQSGYRQ